MLNYQETFHSGKLFLIAGTCVVESESSALYHAEKLKEITSKLGIPFVYKSSYKKANRSSYDSFTGLGIERGLAILAKVKEQIEVPILTDVHEVAEVQMAAQVADILQSPSFLMRQSDLLTAMGLTGRVSNIKRAQFASYEHVKMAAEKIRVTGNDRIIITERGSCFGHGDLIVDYRGFPIMAELGYPVVFDAGHSVQKPTGDKTTGGQRFFIPTLARAAVAAGANGIFLECHQDPSSAKSDAAVQWPLNQLHELLVQLLEIFSLRQRW